LDGKPVPAYKPQSLKDGAELTFGQLQTRYVVRVESAGKQQAERLLAS
jgi:hypothetical protein